MQISPLNKGGRGDSIKKGRLKMPSLFIQNLVVYVDSVFAGPNGDYAAGRESTIARQTGFVPEAA